MLVKAPHDPRALFEAFRHYRAEAGIDSVPAAFDFAGAGFRQLYWAAFGCLPEAASVPAEPAAFDARSTLNDWLRSTDFQKHVLERLLAAYAGKRRLLIVHIPKCAGSDLTLHLRARFPSISRRIVEPGWADAARLAGEIKALVEKLAFSECIFVHGHAPLARQMANGNIRFGDPVFTIVRDPAEMVLSKINYVITLFGRDPLLARGDTRSWMRSLDRDRVAKALASGDTVPLGREILHSPKLVQDNAICAFLGRGSAASAFALCAQADAEVTDVARYQDWLLARWGVSERTRKNASVKHLSAADLDGTDRAHVARITQEDRTFHDAVRRSLDASGACSVRGLQLAVQAA